MLEAISLFDEGIGPAAVIDSVRMPREAKRAVDAYVAARRKAEEQGRVAAQAARKAVATLTAGELRLSARDASRLLGLSHQRVHQLGAGRT